MRPGSPCETQDNSWAALWFHGFSWWDPSKQSMQCPHLLPLSPVFQANFHILLLEPSSWSVPSQLRPGPEHKHYQWGVPRNEITHVDWTWTDLETRVHIVRFAPKGVLTILKHVFRVKRSSYLYSIINFLLPDVGCHSQPPHYLVSRFSRNR